MTIMRAFVSVLRSVRKYYAVATAFQALVIYSILAFIRTSVRVFALF